ncbi:E3 SUMO-protein ligase pli1 [Coemansia sp. RSA 922]|nr:E3 SUMO-protein ligase pli1 [Coemansia sp. S155-1]KAJ2109905.1 E3 SUMO-protein ligase pli1 [Coemansia sp. RSA 922]KAJ2352567.1 E3 SUMO-protein ligase pli1 [Coemansia sp. RSA 2673]
MPHRNETALTRPDNHAHSPTHRQLSEIAARAHVVRGIAASTTPGIVHGQTASGFDGLVFGDSNFVLPVQNLTRPEVFMESAPRMNSKMLNLKLTIDQVDMLTADPTDSDPAPYGVYLFMCQYSDACNSIAQTPKRAVHIAFPQQLSVAANSALAWSDSKNTHCKSPIDLTGLVTKTAECNNIIRITYSTPTRWVAAIVLSKRHTAHSIASEIRKSHYISADKVRQAFFNHTSTDDDDDLVSTGALVSLKCPLGLSRISTPSRSAYCQHPQCFDCEIFMQLTRKLTVWKCPVCSIVIKSWQELIVDGYFESILKGTSAADDQVYIEPNGEWKLKKEAPTPRKELQSTARRPLEVDDNDTIDLSDSSAAGYQSTARNKRRRTEVVDLTLDSDDEGADTDDILEREANISLTQEEIDLISSVENDIMNPASASTNLSSISTTRSSSAMTLNNSTSPSSGRQPVQGTAVTSASTTPTGGQTAARLLLAAPLTPTNGVWSAASKIAATAPPTRHKNRPKHNPAPHRRLSGDVCTRMASNATPTQSRFHADTLSSPRPRVPLVNLHAHSTRDTDTQRNENAIANAVAFSAARANRVPNVSLSGGSAGTTQAWTQYSHSSGLTELAIALTTRTLDSAPTTHSSSASLGSSAQTSPRSSTAGQVRAPQRPTVTPIAPRLSTAAPNTVPRAQQPVAPPAAHRSHSQGNFAGQGGSPTATAPLSSAQSRGASNAQSASQPAQPLHVGMSPTYSTLFLSAQTAGSGSATGGKGAASNERSNGPTRYAG